MRYDAWRSLKKGLFFTTEEVARNFGMTKTSAHVFCSRQVKNGSFIRLKKNFYVLEDRWPYLEREDFFVIANFLQVPSYVSCTTALAYHGVTTQVPRDWVESMSLKRSIQYSARGMTFSYFKLKKDFYFGFKKIGPFFIAGKEKAFLDACHLCAYGRYALDWSALDMDRLDTDNLRVLMKPYPFRTKNMVEKLCGI